MGYLKKQIKAYIPYNEQEEKDKQVILHLMDKGEDLLTRENEIAHFTSSAWVVNKQRTKALMAYHNIYDSWAWLGGHADGEEDLFKVAVKEIEEESGLKQVTPIWKDIFSLEILRVNGHEKHGAYVSTHLHLNVTYLLEMEEKTELLKVKPDENKAVKWIPLEMVEQAVNEKWMRERIYPKLIRKLGKCIYYDKI